MAAPTGDVGRLWDTTGSPRCHGPCPHGPSHPSLGSRWAAGLCLPLNPPNYPGRGNKKQGGGKRFIFCLFHAYSALFLEELGLPAQRGCLSPGAVRQSCSHSQKIQPWLVAFGIRLEGKGAAGGERREREGQAGRKGAGEQPLAEHRADGALPFPPGKGPAASAVPQPPNPARPPFTDAELLAVPLLIASHRAETQSPFQKETTMDPQPGQGEAGMEGCPGSQHGEAGLAGHPALVAGALWQSDVALLTPHLRPAAGRDRR